MDSDDKQRRFHQPFGVIARLCIRYSDGTEENIDTDSAWEWAESPVRFSEIYDGERYDARIIPENWQPVSALEWPKEILIPQEGVIVRETERIPAKQIIRTPAGETVVDFGQEVTGYAEFSLTAASGDTVRFTHGEMLDLHVNFYNANYRGAKALVDGIHLQGRTPTLASPDDFLRFSVYQAAVLARRA